MDEEIKVKRKITYSLLDLDQIDHKTEVGRGQIRLILEGNYVDPAVVRWALDLCENQGVVADLKREICRLKDLSDDLHDEIRYLKDELDE